MSVINYYTGIIEASGAGAFSAPAVKYDGVGNYIYRSALTGSSSFSTGILSFWINLANVPAGASQVMQVYNPTALSGVACDLVASGGGFYIRSLAFNNSSSSSIVFGSPSTTYSYGSWYNFLMSWDMSYASPGMLANYYVNDSAVTDKGQSGPASSIDYTGGAVYINGNGITVPPSSNLFQGCLSELYFAPGQYLDFTVTDNRRKFINSSGKPSFLGYSGLAPTGIQPKIYIHRAYNDSYGTNDGDGGNFNVVGSYSACASSPSS